MAVKRITLCLLSVTLLGSLGWAQDKYFSANKPQDAQKPQYRPNVNPHQYQQPGQKLSITGQPQQPQKPTTPEFSTCQVAQPFKIRCGVQDISQSDCHNINCCFDGQMCHFGNAVTLQCTKDARFIVVIARDATLPKIDLDSIHFMGGDQNCQPAGTNPAFVVYDFHATSCGSIITASEEGVTYENRISSSFEVAVGPYGAITRDSHFELLVQCRYTGSAVHGVVSRVGPLPPPLPVAAPGPVRVELRLGNGQCTAKGCVEADVAYSSYYLDSEHPVTKVLRDPVYVEVRMLERTDPNLVLTLGRCWGTSIPNPFSLPQWDLLVDGCPYRDDRYLTTLVPVVGSPDVPFPTHYRRFIFKMFAFVGTGSADGTKKNPQDAIFTPLKEMVYIHCNTAVCQPTAQDNCEPRCFRRRRDVGASVKSDFRQESTTVSSPPIIFMRQRDDEQ